MALSQPILNPIPAFDATKEQIITFNVYSGDQVFGNTITIKNNQTGEIVYTDTLASFQYNNTIPANTLTNGLYYNITVATLDSSQQVQSPVSYPVAFYCYTNPTLTITNITEGETIQSSSFIFKGLYNQLEGELLNSWQYILYDFNKDIITKTPLSYDDNIVYPIQGLDNNTQYYIELTGITVNKTQITSGILGFSVQYIRPPNFSIVELTNDYENGYIQINSNIVAIDGTSNPDPVTYIENKEVDLTEDGSWVNWDSGFNIANDFTIRIWGRNYTLNSNLLTASSSQDTTNNPYKFTLDYMESTDNKVYMQLKAWSGLNMPYIITSNEIEKPTEKQQIFTWIRKKNNLYDLVIENLDI